VLGGAEPGAPEAVNIQTPLKTSQGFQ